MRRGPLLFQWKLVNPLYQTSCRTSSTVGSRFLRGATSTVVKALRLGEGELVRDAMPKDFEESVRNSPGSVNLYAGTARTWDGETFSYVADRVKGEELSGRTRVRWRPKIELRMLGKA